MLNHNVIVSKIKGRGERITMPRLAVIEALCALGGHQTTQNLQHHLAAEGVFIQESSVYRVLQWLKELGFVAQTDLGQSGITYELISTPPHHHLVCLNCGGIQELADAYLDDLRQHLRSAYDFVPRIEHMAFFGICQNCQNEASE